MTEANQPTEPWSESTTDKFSKSTAYSKTQPVPHHDRIAAIRESLLQIASNREFLLFTMLQAN